MESTMWVLFVLYIYGIYFVISKCKKYQLYHYQILDPNEFSIKIRPNKEIACIKNVKPTTAVKVYLGVNQKGFVNFIHLHRTVIILTVKSSRTIAGDCLFQSLYQHSLGKLSLNFQRFRAIFKGNILMNYGIHL